ncbi:MAG: signal peptidase II [Nanoarchaeota archaeon]|nr:signal peptidase II [Nanoarchaeota archaeon]
MKQISIILLPILLFDIITKQVVKQQQIQTTGHFFDITYATNTGTMWSLFANFHLINILFITLSLLALGFLYYYMRTQRQHIIPVSIISAGIIGNLLDRIIYGFVIDWANFHFWPIFNIADSAIVIGTISLMYLLVKEEVRK